MHYLKIAVEVFRSWWARRSQFASTREALRAIALRFWSLRSLRGRTTRECVALRLAGVERPVYLRRGTLDIIVLEEIFLNREYGPAAAAIEAEAPRLLDLGGNIGLASRFFDEELPGVKIVVVEPDAGNHTVLRKNCARLLEEGRLTAREAFVAAESGAAGIHRGDEPVGYRIDHEAADGEQIECVTVPTLLDEAGFDRVDLLKCDIEGAEAELFAACGEWIHRVDQLVVETHAPYGLEQLEADLAAAGWPAERVSVSADREKFAVAHYRRRAE